MIGGNTLLAAATNGDASGGQAVHQLHNGSAGGGVSNGNPFAIMPQAATILPNQSQCHISNGNGTGFTINNNNNMFVHYNLLNTVAAAAGVGNYVCEGQLMKHPGGGGSSVHATSSINGGGFGSGGGCGLATSATATPTAAPAAATMTPATTSATTVGIGFGGGGGGGLLMYDCSGSVSCGGAAAAAVPIAAAVAIASTSAATSTTMTTTAQATTAVAGSTAASVSTAKIPYSAGGGGLSTSFSSSPICSLATSFYPCNKVLLL